MATSDQQVLVVGQTDAPAQLMIPGNGQIEPKTIFASYDGTGAAGAFLPAIKVLSDAGEIVGIFPTSTSVAAGASADVTWFPGAGGLGAGSGVGVVPLAAGRVDPVTPITVPAHSAIEIPWFEVNVNDASQFSWSSGTPSILNVTDGGIVLYSLTIMPDVDWPLAAAGFIRFWGHSGSDVSFETTSLFASYPAAQLYSDQGTGPYPITISGIPAPSDLVGSKTWQAHVFNSTAADWKLGAGSHFTVARLSDLVFD